jgi:putative transposase
MSKLYHPLLTLIATATDRLLAHHLEYLKEENRILRARIPKQIHTTPEERGRLLKLGKRLGKDIDALIGIVTPATFHRWVREEERGRKSVKGNRPRRDLRELVRHIAAETDFGYTRILGELRKLGIRRICRQTVKNILKEQGTDPRPKCGKGTWDEFLRIHAKTLWACDFFSKRAITKRGIVDLYAMVFIHLDTREIFVTTSTARPNSKWVAEQARNFLTHVADRDDRPGHLLRDRDRKFTRQFDAIMNSSGVKPKLLPFRSPNLNARCERVIQTIKQECLDFFLVFGSRHLDYLISEFVDYYNTTRSHSRRDHLPPLRQDLPDEHNTIEISDIVCRERLGGLIKSFERAAA